MITCPKCGNQLPDGAKFCKFCGVQFTQRTVQNNAQHSVSAKSQKPKKSPNKITYAIIAILLVVAVAAGAFLIFGKDDANKEKTSVSDNGLNGDVGENGNFDSTATKSSGIKAEVGDYITFGAYEQDNDTSNGKEDIEWLVLDKQDGRMLVISKYALDCQPYNTEYEDVTWETCTLRTWMNNEFINTAFTSEEKSSIPTVIVKTEDHQWGAIGGEDTKDKVFLLSINEAEEYFSSDSERECQTTAYAEANGASTQTEYGEEYYGNCAWQLRSPGEHQSDAAYINIDGYVDIYGDTVDDDFCGLRPALWINI